jgi:arabinose-5-phosphate isomerase
MDAVTAEKLLRLARTRIGHEAAGVLAIADQLDAQFLALVEQILGLPGKVFTTGSGTSGIMARRLAHLLSVCGTPALFLHPMDALHGAMGAVAGGDLLIAISRGGGSSEINELARRVQPLGVAVVALTSAPASELAQLADTNFHMQLAPDVDPGNIIAMGSTLAVGAWSDALAYLLMLLRGHSWEQVLHSHPAGAVGQLEQLPPNLAPGDA